MRFFLEAYESSADLQGEIGDRPRCEFRIKRGTLAHENRNQAVSRKYLELTAFSLIFRVGIDNEKVDRNPATGIRRKTENNARVRLLSAQEEKALRKVIAARFPPFLCQLEVSIHTGMRAGEQFGLKWSQIDFERRILTLPKNKNGSTRHIPLNAVARPRYSRSRQDRRMTPVMHPSSQVIGIMAPRSKVRGAG